MGVERVGELAMTMRSNVSNEVEFESFCILLQEWHFKVGVI